MKDLSLELGQATGAAVAQAGAYAAAAVETAEHARALVSFCKERELRIHPWNGGPLPSRDFGPDVVLAVAGRALGGEWFIANDDFYCEAPAAMTVEELRRRLDGTPLWFPFAAAAAAAMTCGELVSRYPPNALAPRYGQLHRFLFGLAFVNDDGDVVATGRRTIKGVAGYDLSKLHLGARGRSGLLTRVRFRLFSRPRAAALWRSQAPPLQPAPAGICVFHLDGTTHYYADGADGDVDVVGRVLVAKTVTALVAQGHEATEGFVKVLDGGDPPDGPPEDGPAFSGIFV